ncbi:sodium:solute symporter family protein [Halobacterium sp. KA-4]|jgi:SSS family solute:Na+ symporter|uniref:sodium:solute symporter family protein n=1 Tax=Halobacterium sp. KA-4 TaxID=2896367 RepID=UPI001E41753C|nr:sodium:solute symporter family protein [Halobacterium sp. KA-4]MCD2200006.1 sodium:solute symporter family protein [Halobacterium sp. KA-4]
MSALLEISIVAAYMLVALGVGAVAYRVTDRTAEDYYLAGRGLGTGVLLFTTFATLLSAFTFFGGPNTAFSAGPEWILVMGLMDGVLFGLLWYLLGYRQWLLGRAHGYVTLGEMLGDRFGSKTLRGLVAGVSIFWLFPYVMLQQVGAGTALEALTNGTVPYWAGAGFITLFMIAYVVLSGMRGVAWTDTLQGVFMLSMVWLAFAWIASALAAEPGGIGAAMPTEFRALGGGVYSLQWMLSQAIGIAFGVTMFPQVNQRFFVGKSEKVLKRTFALWPVLVVLLFVPAFLLGSWAQGVGLAMPDGGNILPVLLAEYTPGWFAALVVAGALAAMMSSSDSMLLSGASYFTRDLYRPFVNADASEGYENKLGRIGVVVFASATFVASLFTPGTLVSIGETAFGGFAQLALPVGVALYWRNTTRSGMLAGVGGSQLFYLVTVFGPTVYVGGVPVFADAYWGWLPSVVGMAIGLVLTVGVSAVTAQATSEDTSVYFEAAD